MNFGLAEYSEVILVALILSVVVIVLLQLAMAVRISKANKRTKRLWEGTNKDSIENSILGLLNEIEELRQKNQQLSSQVLELERKITFHIARTAIVRYNAFGERGNDLSFSIALLNEHDDGVVITSIYNREQSTTYAKPIVKGSSSYPLSTEEARVIEDAKKK